MFRMKSWVVATGLLLAVSSWAQEKKADSPFARITRSETKQPQTFETSIARYEAATGPLKGLVVDMVSAIHVGDKEYYEKLNREFKQYDVVLYEFVAPAGMIPQKGQPPRGFVTRIQHLVKSILGLTFQLDEVDYEADNFVHADMTPDEFAQSMKDRNETFFTMFFKLMMQSYTAQMARENGEQQDIQMLLALFRTDREMALKRIMAEQFSDMELLNSAINGPDGSTIVSERNKKALQVLRQQINRGKRKIAVFYGCAHMPDFDQRLIDDFGLKRTNVRWIVAWDMRDKPKDPSKSKPAVREKQQKLEVEKK